MMIIMTKVKHGARVKSENSEAVAGWQARNWIYGCKPTADASKIRLDQSLGGN